MLRPFELHQPATVQEASRLHERRGDDAGFYAGGTELLLVMKEGLLRYAHLMDLKTIPGLDGIIHDAGSNTLRISALHECGVNLLPITWVAQDDEDEPLPREFPFRLRASAGR